MNDANAKDVSKFHAAEQTDVIIGNNLHSVSRDTVELICESSGVASVLKDVRACVECRVKTRPIKFL